MPEVLVSGDSRPDSPSDPITWRLMARSIALRTASWLVGHVFRFGHRALELPAASQKWWSAGLVSTKSFCRPGM